MKRRTFLISLVMSFLFFSCATLDNVVNPSEIEYTEISAKEYIASKRVNNLMQKGYKVTDVYVLKYSTNTNRNYGTDDLITIVASKDDAAYEGVDVYVTDFSNEFDGSLKDRINFVIENQKFNGNLTFHIYKMTEGNFLDGYITKYLVYDIEGIPTQEQIDAELAAIEAEKKAQEEAARKAQQEKDAALNSKGKKIAEGFIYHGIEEAERNQKMFVNDALESGHAYYIPGFVVKYGGSMAKIEYGDIFFLSYQSNAVYVDYISKKIKSEVVEAGIINFMGETVETPLTVVVAGGIGYSDTPVVLGIVESEINNTINEGINNLFEQLSDN